MLMDMDMLVLILSEEEESEGGEGLRFSVSCLWRKSRQVRWMLQTRCMNTSTDEYFRVSQVCKS